MYSYTSQFFGGELDPTWPHIILIVGCIVGGALVGLGVILEAPKILSIPVAAVFVGVVIEAVCTLLLFGFDEGISTKQQSQLVIAIDRASDAGFDAVVASNSAAEANERAALLEKNAAVARAAIADANARAAEATQKAAEAQLALEKLKTPRTLWPNRQQTVANAIRLYAGQRYRASISPGADDGVAFWESLYRTLKNAGWVFVPPTRPPTVGDPPANIPVAAIPGVEIRFDPAKERELIPAALALANALHADGTVVAVNRDRQSYPNDADRDVLLIVLGARVAPP